MMPKKIRWAIWGAGALCWILVIFRFTGVSQDSVEFNVTAADLSAYEIESKSVNESTTQSDRSAYEECGGISINTADASRLESLPGIGPVLAGRILEYRTEHGPFTKGQDLIAVKGIGPATLAKISGLICF